MPFTSPEMEGPYVAFEKITEPSAGRFVSEPIWVSCYSVEMVEPGFELSGRPAESVIHIGEQSRRVVGTPWDIVNALTIARARYEHEDDAP